MMQIFRILAYLEQLTGIPPLISASKLPHYPLAGNFPPITSHTYSKIINE